MFLSKKFLKNGKFVPMRKHLVGNVEFSDVKFIFFN